MVSVKTEVIRTYLPSLGLGQKEIVVTVELQYLSLLERVP